MSAMSTIADPGTGRGGWRHRARRVWRWVRWALLVVTGLGAVSTSALLIAVYAFPYDRATLTEGGAPLVIMDRHGEVLRTVPSPDGRPGRAGWTPLEEMPASVITAVIQSEDDGYWDHGGIDGRAVARAAWLDLRSGAAAYGGSTITMQLARMVHSAGRPRSGWNKLREAVIALRMERALSKREILEQYLNRAYYGNGAYGIEAAARLYFDKPAASLSTAEAILLAVLPRSPNAYDPVQHLEAAVRRRDHVMGLLVARGLLGADEAERAKAQALAPALHQPPAEAPHFTDWAIAQLPDEVRARGGVVHTTLDARLQQQLEHRAAEHVAGLVDRSLAQAGAVVLDTQTGEVLAMVGSPDYDADAGQINIATRRRHPGSALKPFVYALAIEHGDNPASIAWDLHDVESDYWVADKSDRERGPVRYREALAGSYNLAAVHVLEKVGVARLMTVLRKARVAELAGSPDDYGLRLALGSARVRLVDLAAGYGFLARGGTVTTPTAVRDVARDDGTTWRPPPPRVERIFSERTAWLVMDMLADPVARRPGFGQELPVELPFPIAVKTGTSRGFADTVAVGVTREYTVAAWGGNFDGSPSQGLVAMISAAPLVRDGFLAVARGRSLTLPEPPEGIVTEDVCALSGLRPSDSCPHHKREHFAAGREPTRTCDWHHEEAGRIVVDYPPQAEAWAERERTRGGRAPATAAP